MVLISFILSLYKATIKEHASMRKAQEFAQMAQREIDLAESICPDCPIIVDGVRIKKGGLLGMFMFNGFLGEMHYRQMINKNEVNLEKMQVAVQAGIKWCATQPSPARSPAKGFVTAIPVGTTSPAVNVVNAIPIAQTVATNVPLSSIDSDGLLLSTDKE